MLPSWWSDMEWYGCLPVIVLCSFLPAGEKSSTLVAPSVTDYRCQLLSVRRSVLRDFVRYQMH